MVSLFEDLSLFCRNGKPSQLSLQVTRDYDEEEQGYDSEKEREEKKDSDDSAVSPRSVEGNGTGPPSRDAKVNGDDHHEEDMDVSDWVTQHPPCM